MTSFDSFSPNTLAFLRGLKANNSKEWFATNKAAYEEHLKKPGQQFAEAMARAVCELTGHDHSSKVFRIYRDVRFSKDKTPYNAHLHLAFTPKEQKGQSPMWFFGLSPEKLSLGCGVFQYDRDALGTFRSAMAGRHGAQLLRLKADLRAVGVRVSEPDLKRVPVDFDKNHPNGEALRHKGFTAWIDQDDPAFAIAPELVDRTVAEFAQLMPVYRLLCEVGQ